jgi:hypothetical protein
MPRRMMPAPNIAVPARHVGEVSLAAVRMPKVTPAMRRRTDAPPFRSRHACSPTMVDKIMTVTRTRSLAYVFGMALLSACTSSERSARANAATAHAGRRAQFLRDGRKASPGKFYRSPLPHRSWPEADPWREPPNNLHPGGNKSLSPRISTRPQPITLDGDSNACSEPFRRRDGHRLAHRGSGLNNDHMVRLER